MSLRALFAPQGEGLEVKVQGQLAEWPQKPRLSSASDPFFHTSLQPQWRDQFATFVSLHYNLELISLHNEVTNLVWILEFNCILVETCAIIQLHFLLWRSVRTPTSSCVGPLLAETSLYFREILILLFFISLKELHLSRISHPAVKRTLPVLLFKTPLKVFGPHSLTPHPPPPTRSNFSLLHHPPNMSSSQVYYAVSRRPKLQLHGEQSGAH